MATKKEKLARYFEDKRKKRNQKISRILLAIAIIILLMLLRCSCTPEKKIPVTLTPTATPRVKATPVVRIAPSPKPRRTPLNASEIQRSKLPAIDNAPEEWLEELRTQAAARSAQMAECLDENIRSPGAIRWIFAVDRLSGESGEHSFEGLGSTPSPSAEEALCFVEILSKPPFQFQSLRNSSAAERKAPVRVSLVIEF